MKQQINLFESLKFEHRALLSLFEIKFHDAKRYGKWNTLIEFSQSHFEDNHHQKEELYIFEIIKNDPRIKAGGPLCTYYFDAQLAHPPLDTVIKLVKDLTGYSLSPEWSSLMKEIRDRNLPLLIPGEDHESGRILLRAAKLIHTENKSESINLKLEKIFQLYWEIQQNHFQKEENCFFPMCLSILKAAQWADTYNLMVSQFNDIRLDKY